MRINLKEHFLKLFLNKILPLLLPKKPYLEVLGFDCWEVPTTTRSNATAKSPVETRAVE